MPTIPICNTTRPSDGAHHLTIDRAYTEVPSLVWSWVIFKDETFLHELAVGLDLLMKLVKMHHPDGSTVNTYCIEPGPALTAPKLEVTFGHWPRRS